MSLEGRISINLATTRGAWGFAEAVDGCLRHGITSISPWRDQVHAIGLKEAVRIIEANGIKLTGHCRGGMFPAETAEGRQANIDDNKKAVDEAAAMGADCLVLVVGGLPGSSKNIAEARKQVVDGIAAILPYAQENNMPLAIEPLHPMYAADRACVNTLGHALDICEELGEGVGVAVDVYHVWWDPELEAQIARAGKMGLILAHHICDWLVPTKDLLLDRGMMGDGVIDLPRIRRWIEDAGFKGAQEVEIFSQDNWWKRSGDETLATCIERFDSVCNP